MNNKRNNYKEARNAGKKQQNNLLNTPGFLPSVATQWKSLLGTKLFSFEGAVRLMHWKYDVLMIG